MESVSERTDEERNEKLKSQPNMSDGEDENDIEIRAQMDPLRMWQLILSKRQKDILKVKSRIKSCQLHLEEQDEQLKGFQEQIAKRRAALKTKDFDWTPVRTAHLISKVFEFCKPVTRRQFEQSSTETDRNERDKSKDKEEREDKNKCLYTADFHRFAIALYFFSPKSYFFLSNIAPMFPHRNYIRQWVTSGGVEKLFPPGVYREEFSDLQ